MENETFRRQAVSYGWHKGVTYAILTNFESLLVFNCEWEETSFWKSIVLSLKYNQYIQDIDRLILLSKESFFQNALDKYADKIGKRIPRRKITEQLLVQLIEWRKKLSSEIKRNHKDAYSEQEVDEIVQRILDRLIFIRNCEDRGFEEKKLYGALVDYKDHNKSITKSLRDIYRYYDTNYDSKLLEIHETDKVEISDDILKKLINNLYYTSPPPSGLMYDFSLIDADILGNLYEQYLAFVAKAKNKDKEEARKSHKKEQGIYYTPTYIVTYIINNTLGELAKDKKFDMNKVRILDPACGSGSFLIKAFDFLITKSANKDLEQMRLGSSEIETTYSKKVEILKNNVFGVDLDPKAVEIAQLNLLLKAAEKKHRLPTLQENIKVGNSIIDDPNIVGDKAFIWEDKFKEIISDKGFDIIIGNPPYGAELNEKERNYIFKFYKFSNSNKNTALIFMEKSLNLLKENGFFGMIVPKSLTYSQLWKPGRELIKNNLVTVVDVSKAFHDVLLEQVIIILKKNNSKLNKYTIYDISTKQSISIDKKYIELTDSFILHGNIKEFEIFKKMNSSSKYLSEITKTSRGLPLQKYLTNKKTKYPIIKGKTISRFNYSFADEYLPEDVIEKNHSKIKFLQQPKVISQRIVAHVTKPKDHIIMMSALDKEGHLTIDTVENTVLTDRNYSLEFILCLLNSKLVSWYAYRYIFSKAIRTMDLDDYYVGKIPLPTTKVDNKLFFDIINEMALAQKKLLELGDKITEEKNKLELQIEKIEAKLNDVVYEIYGLSKPEQKIIEESLLNQ